MSTSETGQRGNIVQEEDGVFELFPLPADEATLLSIFEDCFEEWEHLHIGPLIQGAAWEIRPAPQAANQDARRLRNRGLRGLALSHLHRGTQGSDAGAGQAAADCQGGALPQVEQR